MHAPEVLAPGARPAPAAVAPVALLALATAVPENVLEQQVAASLAQRVYGERLSGFEALSRVFTSTGIERRYLAEPFAWYQTERSFAERSESYVRAAGSLFANVATEALARARMSAADVDAVVFVSSTGIATPTIDARVMPGLGFRPDVERLPVFGLGCAGGVTGLAIATRVARARPGALVLLVTIELCSLAFRPDRPTKKDLVSVALFGDGAAAALLRCDGKPGTEAGAAGTASNGAATNGATTNGATTNGTAATPRAVTVGAATEHLWPGTLDIMGWSVDDIGLGVILSRSLPAFIAREFAPVYHAALGRMGLAPDAVDRVICHPGATKVLESIEASLGLAPATLATERSVMRDYGNMSSPTVLFVLERSIATGFSGAAVLAALGPGFTGSFVSLEVA